jgi:hypothetical protein
VYEGTQLDKSLHGEDLKSSENLQPQDLSCRTSETESPTQDEREIEAMHTNNNNDKNKTSVNTPHDEDSMSSESSEDREKSSRTITSKDMDWGDINHQEKIQKLQQNLTTQSGTEDWAF